MHYRNILVSYNDESFRLIRLKNVIDEIYLIVPHEYIDMIKKIKDEKGTLIIYWSEKPSLFFKTIINSIWMDHYETYTKHIIIDDDDPLNCKCCNSPPQKMDPEINAYLNLNYII